MWVNVTIADFGQPEAMGSALLTHPTVALQQKI
jgi:hypothetical protein